MGKLAAVVSGKGGTGKTSICAALGSCLALDGQSVLCVDLDVGLRNLDIALGMSEEAALPFTALMRGEYALSDAAAHPDLAGLRMLTAPVSETEEQVDEPAFLQLMEKARAQFDWILLDAPAGVGPLFRLAGRAADERLIVSLADPASVRDAARAAELLELQGCGGARLIVNRVNPKLFSCMHATVDDLMDSVGLPLLGLVPEDPSVTLAAAAGKPLVQVSFAGAALACLNISRRLCGQRVKLMKF